MIIGTAGHIDHGKTALVRALTGIDTDRLPAEKARGITIDLGFAYRPVPGAETLGFVDVPGHEAFVHNMLAGAVGIDFVLLVVAADDGPMPQTREHLQIVDLLGIERGIVALSKCDLVSAERIAEVAAEVHQLLDRTSLATAEIMPVSIVTGEGVAGVEAHLLDAARSMPSHRVDGRFRLAIDRFRLAIDRCFSLPGIGTVVTGTVFAGEVRAGDRVVLSPSGLAARVRSLHAQNAAATRGVAGQRCALNLVGSNIDKERIHRGDWVLDEALHLPTDRIDANIRLLPSEVRTLRQGTPVHLHVGAARVSARIAILDRESLPPGDRALAQIVLDRPVGALHGDRVVLRDDAARRTIGGGIVLDPWPPDRGRRRPQRLAALAAMSEADAGQALVRVASADPGWVDLGHFARARNLSVEKAASLRRIADIVCVEADGAAFGFGGQNWQVLKQATITALAGHHEKARDSPGLETHRLRLAVDARLPADVFAAAVSEMVRDGTLQRDGPWLRLASHSVRLTAADERLWGRIHALMERTRFQPPRVRDFSQTLGASEAEVRQLLRRLARMGTLVEVAHDHFYTRTTIAELAATVQRVANGNPEGKITAAVFRDRIGTGRKLAIQILEFFDRTGITIREGDLRGIRQDRLAIFEEPGR
jgi:selenocysteine-specific elongation factor